MSYKLLRREYGESSEIVMLERHDYHEMSDGRVTSEEELARYLIGDAIMRMRDKWAKRIDRREAFEFLFSNDEWGESLEYWCDVAGMQVEVVRHLAMKFYLNPVLVSNPMKKWCDV